MAFSTPTLYDPSAAPDGTLDGVASWSKGNYFGSPLSVLNHRIRVATSTGGCFWRQPFGNDQQVWGGLITLGANLIVLHLRGTGYATGPETGYAAYADTGAGTVGFARIDGGTIGLIGVTTPAPFASTDLLGASVVGSTLSVFRNDERTLLASMTDRTYSTGSTIGLQLFDTTAEIGLFGGGPTGGAPVAFTASQGLPRLPTGEVALTLSNAPNATYMDGWPLAATGEVACTATPGVYTSGFAQSGGAVSVNVDGAGTWQAGFLRDANGSLCVTATGPFTWQGGFVRDAAGRLGAQIT